MTLFSNIYPDHPSKGPWLLVAGHLPPPTHGMAVATAAFADLLREECETSGVELRLHQISADRTSSRTFHHIQRLARVLHGGVLVARRHRTLRALYISADAGLGMFYTMLLTLVARLVQRPSFIHHHSVAYLGNRPDAKMKALCRVAGARATHIFGCSLMAERFTQLYRYNNVGVVPISFAIDYPASSPDHLGSSFKPPPKRNSGPPFQITIGHLSNLSVAKGLRDVFRTADCLTALGAAVSLVLAGPPATPSDAQVLDQLLNDRPYPVAYLGPVHGLEREAFFRSLDIFLFPSRYRHESFGLVAGEALGRGIPIVAYTNGCLTSDFVANGGYALSKSLDFPTEAAEWILDNYSHPQQWEKIQISAKAFHESCNEATRDAQLAAAKMVEGSNSW